MDDNLSTVSSLFNKIWNGLLKFQRFVMLVSIIVSVTCIFIEVIFRYFFKSSIIGIAEIGAYVAFWMYFIGSSYGTHERCHVKAELTHLVFKNKASYAKSRFFASLISLSTCIYILPWAWDYFEWGLTMKEKSSSTFMGSTYQVVYFQSAILVGLTLTALYLAAEAIMWFSPAFKGNEVTPDMEQSREEIDTWI